MVNELKFATIKTLRHYLDTREISQEELINFYKNRIEKYKDINAFIECFEIDFNVGFNANSVLSGIPGAIKDTICQKDKITSCASNMLRDFRSPYDATVVKRLKDAGAIMMGRANCDEFAMGSSGETSAYGKTKNPWAYDCVPGGSSSGSAAAVAAGLVPWALGTETGGSVRHPAAMCGLVGMKPTYGCVSRYGLIAYGSSLDQVGVLTKTVYDNALIFSEIAGYDQKDSTSIKKNSKKNYTNNLTGVIPSNLKIGVVQNALNQDALDPAIKKSIEDALDVYRMLGAEIIPIEINTLEYAAATYFIISRAEAASNLARFDAVRYGYRSKNSNSLLSMYENSRCEGFGEEVKARILVGNYVLSAGYGDQFYINAQKVRHIMRSDFQNAFNSVDLLIMPTHSIPAFRIGQFDDNKLAMDLQDYYTAAMNLTGLPAVSVPSGFSKDGKPLGMQLIGNYFDESLLYQCAYAYEKQTIWHTMNPDMQ